MMRALCAKSLLRLLLGCCLVLPGCSEGPMVLELAALNPYNRKKWAEDEQYGPTFYTRVAEIKAVRDGAASLTPQQQEHLAGQLSDIVQYDENPLMRREAVLALGALATPAAVPALRTAVDDKDAAVRAAACRAWGQRGGPEAASLLATVVGSDQDLDVRLTATEELAAFTDPAAVNALGVALNDSDPALQYRAMRSLRDATGRDYGNDVVAWRDYLQGNTPTRRSPSLVERMTDWF